MKIDIHAHLAGVGSAGSGCWISPAFRKRYTFRILRRWHGITDARMRESVDQEWAGRIAAHVRESQLDRAVALGFDGVYTAAGRLDPERSQMVVPPAWVYEACRRHPELLPGPTVHPGRRDALEALQQAAENGAVLIKWLPTAMSIDPADPGLRHFYARMAEAGIALLCHSGGGERTFAEIAPEFGELRRLELPLEMGVTVICAHSAVPMHLSRDADERGTLRRMLERHPHLWVDNSGMANPSRCFHLPRLADDPAIRERTLFGSDFPVPSNAVYYMRRLGPRRVFELERISNPLDRDIEIKRALGFPDRTLTRAAEVLPALRR